MGTTASGVILLVDDNADDVFLTLHAFARSDINNEIVGAGDGVEPSTCSCPTPGANP
jgi:hypothetical protein